MTKSGMNPVHPGEVLREELDDLGLSANALAKAVDVPANRITAILNGERGVTADTALRLGRYFDTTARFWLNLQQAWQLRQAEINGGATIRDCVVPRQVEALRTAAVQRTQSEPDQGRSVLKAIQRNMAFFEQLSAAERSIKVLAPNPPSLRALVAPLEELRHAGVLDNVLHDEFQGTRRWLTEYHARWLPGDITKLLTPLRKPATPSLVERLAAMKSPWLDVQNKQGSVARLMGLQQVGALIGRQPTFSEAVTAGIRDKLGDWRDPIDWPKHNWRDLSARKSFYVDLGFDENLTDMPAEAFREATGLADIRDDPPSLVESYGPPTPASDAAEEAIFARTNRAHDLLQRFESHLRRFIDTEMKRVFGGDWPKHQLPNGLYEEWKERQDAAIRNGAAAHPIIAYADFTDYERVIARKSNWPRVFKSHFRRVEDIRESLQRLRPIRLDTMHARPVGQDDELFLYVEIKRIMRVVYA